MKTWNTYMILLLAWLLSGATAELRAQTWNPDSPPEPGLLSVTLTSSPAGCASFSQTWDGAQVAGTDVTIHVEPYRDYDFVAWVDEQGKQVATLPDYTFTVTKNRRFTAQLQFNPKDNPEEPGGGYYKLVTTASPTNGGWIGQSGQGLYLTGESVTLTAYAYPDYQFSHWEQKGERVGDEPTLTFTMPKSHAYYTAVYTWNPASPSEPGQASAWLYLENNLPEGGYVSQSGNGVYALGSEVTVEASPYIGYQFDGWYAHGQLLSTKHAYTFTIQEARLTLEARFSKKPATPDTPTDPTTPDQPTVSFKPIDESGQEAHGEIQVQGLAIPGQKITVTALPEEGFAFEGWYLNGVLVEDAEKVYQLMVENDTKSLVAKFRELPFQLTLEGGTKGWAEVARYRGSIARLEAKEVTGYTFMGWYRGETLLSKELHYELDVTSLRAALPQITAKYVEGSTANATVEACSKAARIYAEPGVLHVEPLIEQPMEVWVVSANGRTVYHGVLMEALRLPVPSGLYFVVARQRGERQVEKLCVE